MKSALLSILCLSWAVLGFSAASEEKNDEKKETKEKEIKKQQIAQNLIPQYLLNPKTTNTNEKSLTANKGTLVIFGASGAFQLNKFTGFNKDNSDTDSRTYNSPRSRAFVDVLSGDIIARLGVDITRLFERNGLDFNDDFKIGEFLSDATIDIRNIGDKISAVVIGKQIIPFGLSFPNLPPASYWDNHVQALKVISDVIGFSVELVELPVLEEIVDSVELSIFESSQFDLSIKGGPGYSMRIRKMIETDRLEHEISVSYARIENDHFGQARQGPEQRVSVGVVSETPISDDTYAWAEFIYFDNNIYYRSPKNQVVNVGLTSTILDDKTYWSNEVTWARDYTSIFSTAFWREVSQKMGSQVLLGVEYRRSQFQEAHPFYHLHGDSEDMLGLAVRVLLYKTKAKRINFSNMLK